MTEPITVAVVPHTHWDREWYQPYQTFRLRLVGLIDELLAVLEADPGYTRFLLDGQTAVVDDYLAIRPENEGRLRALIASGRIALGPWSILMDEFMVSGETIVRDLQGGIRRGDELGGAMNVGYLPDMFGHIAQMPQLLALAGLAHAVVWRGVPAALDRSAFWWEAPDGSRVRAEYLWGSYSNGRDLADDPAQLVARAAGYRAELGGAHLPGGGMLLMNGTDHQLPQPWLGRIVAEANATQSDYRFEVTSLAEYLPGQPTAGLPAWRGELRSGARSNVLMGVASNHVDVHQLCAAAERALEKRGEPLSALVLEPAQYPRALLDEAWKQLVLNSAHDSSCACSIDEVVDAVRVRYQEAFRIADGLAGSAMTQLAREVAVEPGATIVVNTTSRARGGLVELTLPGQGPVHLVGPDGEACATQIVTSAASPGFSSGGVGEEARWLLELMRGNEFGGAPISRYAITDTEADPGGAPGVDVEMQVAEPLEERCTLDELRQRVEAAIDAGARVGLSVVLAPRRQVVAAVGAVPGFGWGAFRTAPGDGPSADVTATHGAMSNEHLHVTVDDRDGTFSVRTNDGVEVRGLNRYVDGGDGGDTYNYSPPADDIVVDTPDSVRVNTLESGPVRARVAIEADYTLPTHAVGDETGCSRRAAERVTVTIRTLLELRSAERFVRVRTELDHQIRDHRLRAHFPLPARVTGSDAECAFAVVHRGLTAEGGPSEAGLPTFVSRRFVDATDGETGLALLHDGLLEYEVVDDGRELALTLLRATGYLSRSQPSLRPNPAGPLEPTPGAQVPGPLAFDYAVLPHRGTGSAADLHARADELLVPLDRVPGGGGADAPRRASGQLLSIEGAEVSAITREADGALTVRVFNPAPVATEVHIADERGARTGTAVDLRGRPGDEFTGTRSLRPWEIVSLRLD
jgi:mannosylglycerate hydrolase